MLKKGTKSPTKIKDLQAALSRVGYLTEVDGEFGAATEKSLKAFQKDNSLKVDGEFGPLTEKVLQLKVEGLPDVGGADPVKVSWSKTPWMDFLKRNVGEKEITGKAANQFIVELFNYTSLKGMKIALSDETAWCAACACAALEKNGFESPRSASAASFDKYGEELKTPKFGAVVTFKTTTGSRRHVTFFDHFDSKGRLVCLGGNQGNALKYSTYSKAKLASVRWPVLREQPHVEGPA